MGVKFAGKNFVCRESEKGASRGSGEKNEGSRKKRSERKGRRRSGRRKREGEWISIVTLL